MRRPGRPVGSCRRCSTFAGRASFRARRVELGLSHADIATLMAAGGAPVSARAVCGYELGEYIPGEDRMPVLARILGVRVERLEAWFWPGSSQQSRRQRALPGATPGSAPHADVAAPRPQVAKGA